MKTQYKNDNFHYSCPECRNHTVERKRVQKDRYKNSYSTKIAQSKPHKRRWTEKNNLSAWSGSEENETPMCRNNDYKTDVNMSKANSQQDEQNSYHSDFWQPGNDKRADSEVGVESVEQIGGDTRKIDSKKSKLLNRHKNTSSRIKKMQKKQTDDHTSSDYQRWKETIEEFTKQRSLKFAKERIEIVEARTLWMNVSKFCGLSETFIQDYIQQDLDSILRAITWNDRSESDIYSNSPDKDSRKGNRNWRGATSFRSGINSIRSKNETSSYHTRLRRRTKTAAIN